MSIKIEINENDIKQKYVFEKKYVLYELEYDTRIKHDVMSYGKIRGKFITTTQTLKYLALNSDANLIQKKTFNKETKMFDTINGNFCFVENKSKYYKMGFDFDYKTEKYPELYAGFESMDEVITIYILDNIIDVLKQTLNKPDVKYIFSEKKNSKGQHIYFPNVITNRELHKYIIDETIVKIRSEKKYPNELINQIFDDSIAGANGMRLWYYVHNDDYYFPVLEKSTYKFSPEPERHFDLCIINTNYVNYNFNLLINENIILENNKVINTVQKNKDVKKGIVKPDDDYVEDFKILDLGTKKDLFLKLINIVDIKRIDDAKDWIRSVYAFKNHGIDRSEAIQISKKSKKFDNKSLKTINNIYDKKIVKTNTKQTSLGTVIRWAKEDNKVEATKILNQYYLKQKLDVKSMDEILLGHLNIKPDLIEEQQYISKNATEKFIKLIDEGTECIIMKSQTGTGKTTCIKKLIEHYIGKNPKATIISIITRRSMGSCHLTAFNKDSKIIFNCYLDEEITQMDYFISSLENLTKITDIYDIVILDEVNSLINHFYSSTLEGKRIFCILTLLDLLNKCKLIIAVDAHITDMVFQLFIQLEKKYFYYINEFKNKKDIPFNIFYSTQYNEDNNLINFCDTYIIEKYVKKSKRCLILTDSKKITDKLKLYFLKHNANEDYYRVFNRDEGTLDDIVNVNTVGKNRLFLTNSKIVYGVDILLPYDEIFVIYRKSSGFALGVLEMYQQIGRARDTQAVNLLVLDPRSKNYINEYITYECNKKIQEKLINNFVKFHDDLCKKYKAINELGCTTIDIKGKNKFSGENFMTEIHYLKTWYDQLFHKNKIEILKKLITENGYKIKESDFTPELKFRTSFKKELKLKSEEIVEISRKIYNRDILDKKYDVYVDNLKEMNNMRARYLKAENVNDIDLICDQNKFIKYIYKKYLDLDNEDFNKKIIDFNNLDFIQVVKDNTIINQIQTCFWFEEQLKFRRFEINNIKCDNIEKIVELFKKNVDKFYWIYKTNEGKNKTIGYILQKFKNINNLNKLQKFIADCYNSIVSDIVTVNYKRIFIDNNTNKLGTYYFT